MCVFTRAGVHKHGFWSIPILQDVYMEVLNTFAASRFAKPDKTNVAPGAKLETKPETSAFESTGD